MTTYTFTTADGRTYTKNSGRAVAFGLIVTDLTTGQHTGLHTKGTLKTCEAYARTVEAMNARHGKVSWTYEIVPAVAV